MDEDRVGPFGAEAVDGLLATMSGAVVHDPEDAASGFVGLLVHDFTDEALCGSHAILDSAGKPIRIVGSLADLTSLLQAEQKVLRTRRENTSNLSLHLEYLQFSNLTTRIFSLQKILF